MNYFDTQHLISRLAFHSFLLGKMIGLLEGIYTINILDNLSEDEMGKLQFLTNFTTEEFYKKMPVEVCMFVFNKFDINPCLFMEYIRIFLKKEKTPNHKNNNEDNNSFTSLLKNMKIDGLKAN